MGEESSDTSESDNNDDNQRMPDDFFPGEAKMSNDEAEIQRHTSVQVFRPFVITRVNTVGTL